MKSQFIGQTKYSEIRWNYQITEEAKKKIQSASSSSSALLSAPTQFKHLGQRLSVSRPIHLAVEWKQTHEMTQKIMLKWKLNQIQIDVLQSFCNTTNYYEFPCFRCGCFCQSNKLRIKSKREKKISKEQKKIWKVARIVFFLYMLKFCSSTRNGFLVLHLFKSCLFVYYVYFILSTLSYVCHLETRFYPYLFSFLVLMNVNGNAEFANAAKIT